MLNKKYIN